MRSFLPNARPPILLTCLLLWLVGATNAHSQALLPGDPWGIENLPAGCSVAEVTGLVDELLTLFNHGDGAGFARLFPDRGHPTTIPDPARLNWFAYRSDSAGGVAIEDPRDLPGYVEERHAQEEHLTLRDLRIVQSPEPDQVGLLIGFARQATDLPQEVVAAGKAGISCLHREIFVWSIADLPAVSEATPGPVSIVADSDELFTALRDLGITVVATTAVDVKTASRLVPSFDYVFLAILRGGPLAEPQWIVMFGYDNVQAATTARAEVQWDTDDPRRGLYTGERVLVVLEDTGSPINDLLGDILEAPGVASSHWQNASSSNASA